MDSQLSSVAGPVAESSSQLLPEETKSDQDSKSSRESSSESSTSEIGRFML